MFHQRRQVGDDWRWVLREGEREASRSTFSAGKWMISIVGAYSPDLPRWLRLQLDQTREPFGVLRELWSHYTAHVAIVLAHQRADEIHFAIDPYAIAKLFVTTDEPVSAVSSNLRDIVRLRDMKEPGRNKFASMFFLEHGYTPSGDTFYSGIAKIPPGCLGKVNGGTLTIESYLAVPARPQLKASQYLTDVWRAWRQEAERSVASFDSQAIALSGGVDSSLLLATFLEVGMDRRRCVARTRISLASPSGPILNPYDVEYASRVATHYRIAHDVRAYDWSSSRVLDDYLGAVRELGTEASIGACLFQDMGPVAYSRTEALFAGQNADSVFSFTVTGQPSLSMGWPPVVGLGGWVKRFNLFGGLDAPARLGNLLPRLLLDVYLRRRYRTPLRTRTPRDRLVGLALNREKWPHEPGPDQMSHLADGRGLVRWFNQNYIDQVVADFATNPHGAFVRLFLHTFMQGCDNRATIWPSSASKSPTILPFASLSLLELTLNLEASGGNYWYGKWPVLWMAEHQVNVPRWVTKRQDPASGHLDRMLYAAFHANESVYEHHRKLLNSSAYEVLDGILSKRFLDDLITRHNARQFDQLDLPLLTRACWLLTLEAAIQPLQA